MSAYNSTEMLNVKVQKVNKRDRLVIDSTDDETTKAKNNFPEWRAIELLYKADVERLNNQLQLVLLFRGWAITVFLGTFTALVVYHAPLISIAGIVSLLLFFHSECKYDARRITLLKRISKIEENFFASRVEALKTHLGKDQRILQDAMPLQSDGELSYHMIGKWL